MKIISRKSRKETVGIQVENLDDLWILYNLVQPGDRIDGKTSRRIIVTDHEDDKGERRLVHLKIVVEDVEFHEFANRLRAKGKIVEGPNDLVQLHSYHTFNIEEGTTFFLTKDEWTPQEWRLLEEAARRKVVQKVLVVAIDAGDATFGEIGDYYQKTSVKVSEHIPGKRYGDVKGGADARNNFYAEVFKVLENMMAQASYTKVIITGPGFTREHFMDHCLKKDPGLRAMLMTEASSSATQSGIRELLAKQTVQALLKDSRILEETRLVDELLARVGKDSADFAYGVEEIKRAADMGAIQDLLVADEVMRKVNAEKNAPMLALLKQVEAARGRVTVISTLHEAGKKIRGLGGMAALLRFRLSY
ncbi:MAG: mRNA surveillance protein pelota [Candidatus Lokiarchaeota archaeon]|nr:mRNA surveillance protein pelota [Candidatus Lokiarchaeota archaeon]